MTCAPALASAEHEQPGAIGLAGAPPALESKPQAYLAPAMSTNATGDGDGRAEGDGALLGQGVVEHEDEGGSEDDGLHQGLDLVEAAGYRPRA